MRQIMRLLTLTFALLLLLTGAYAETSALDAFDSPEVIIGVPTGSAAMNAVEARFPNAQLQYTTDSDGYIALEAGKINAFAHDTIVLKYACEQNPAFRLLGEDFGVTNVSVGIARGHDDLKASVNAFIQQIIDSGIRDDMRLRWFSDAEHAMPELPEPEAPTQTIRVGTSGIVTPMTFYGADGKLTGFDIEMLRRMSVQLDARIEISVMNYDALVAGLESGKFDMVVANLNITPERAERIDYSIPYMTSATGLAVRNDSTQGRSDIPTLADLQSYFGKGKRIGIVVGTVFDGLAQEHFPDAEREYFSTSTDLTEALQAGTIDGYLVDRLQGFAQCQTNDQLWMPDIVIMEDSYGIALAYGNEELCAQMDEVILRFKSKGVLDNLAEKWFLTDERLKPMPQAVASGEKGTLQLATDGDSYPFSYTRDGQIVGYSIELFQSICAELGYGCEIQVSDFAGIIASVSSGKADAASSCISITNERKEQMLFTEPIYDGGVTVVLHADWKPAASVDSGDHENAAETKGFAAIWASVSASFERTFIRENRWKLILQGLWTTIIISVCAALLGTLLGFGVCIMRRSRYRALSVIARVFIRLMQGTPIVVFLMILYYVVFGDVEPVLVAVVGFALNFAAYVSEMMRTGIDAVDNGQIEAASAIGFTKARAFLLITLPQAARHFLPVFRGEFISLVKMTSIVGYISIMDLTKMSDIIRSRTYEAFFPLIATAVIYFLLSWLLAHALSTIEQRIDPKRKKRVVRGVNEEEASL